MNYGCISKTMKNKKWVNKRTLGGENERAGAVDTQTARSFI